MIALLIGGTVVLCVGLLTVVFGVPIKEFSFGNTMIVAGTVVSCTGLLLIGLSFVGRELKALARRLEAGIPANPPLAGGREASDLVDVIRSGKNAPDPVPPAPVGRSNREDMLFSRDRSRTTESFPDRSPHEPLHASRSAEPERAAEDPAPWQDNQTRSRNSAAADASEAMSPAAQRQQRRNLLFSSRRRDQTPRELEVRDESHAEEMPSHQPSTEELSGEEAGQNRSNPEPGSLFETAWPQRERPRRDPSPLRSSRLSRTATSENSEPETPRERYQPPKRAETESVTIVKSGVVDSMAYSLYSDGSIEAQMPEGMVRFASIEELRAHLDQRG
ncbi:hypothetical protein [Bradyrhizobium sp. SYSU BS000235]|uniref:hypothetical protein n=1 Tax=Bradyrhizobium sp. SYSU BS000235 TaxID=3411332 RepID=UPI003C744B17